MLRGGTTSVSPWCNSFLPVGWCAKHCPGYPAVDDDLGGIDMRRIVRCKEKNNVCYLFRLTKPAQWYAGLQFLENGYTVFRRHLEALHNRSLDRSGRHHVDANSERRKLCRHCTAHRMHTAFAGCIEPGTGQSS